MDRITREALRIIRADIDKALIEVGKRHGLLLSSGRATFTDTTFAMKVEATIAAGGEQPSDGASAREATIVAKARADFEAWHFRHGIPVSLLGQVITTLGLKRFTVLGWMPSSTRFPVLVRTEDGKLVKLEADAVMRSKECMAAIEAAKEVSAKSAA